jgi:membrane protease YdiL (CAAX protease family)
MKLEQNKWYIKIIIMFIILYLWNNGMYFFFSFYGAKFSKIYFNFFFYIVSYLFLLLIIVIFYRKKINTNVLSKKNEKFLYLIILMVLIYLSGMVKPIFYTHKDSSEILKFSNSILIYFFSTIILAPIIEEFFFRSILINDFIKKGKYIQGIFVTSFLFAISHFPLIYNLQSITIIDFIDIFIFGVILALIRIFLGLKYSILAHTFRNTISVLANYGIINIFLIEYIQNKTVFYLSYYLIILIVIISIIYWLIYIKNHFQKSF